MAAGVRPAVSCYRVRPTSKSLLILVDNFVSAGGRLDLTEFARQLMAQVEKDTGRQLVWAAVGEALRARVVAALDRKDRHFPNRALA